MKFKLDLPEHEKSERLLDKTVVRWLRRRGIVDWECFRPMAEECAPRCDGSRGGWSHDDVVFMFKVLVWKKLQDLSDVAMELRLEHDRLARELLEPGEYEPITDARTIHEFREELVDDGVHERMLACYNEQLTARGLRRRQGSAGGRDGGVVAAAPPERSEGRAVQARQGRQEPVGEPKPDAPDRSVQLDDTDEVACGREQ